MIGEIVKQLIGLFVDDEFLAVAILAISRRRGRAGVRRRFADLARRPDPDPGFAGGARL